MTQPLRLLFLNRDHSERIDAVAARLTDFLRDQPETKVVASEVIENLDPSILPGVDLVVVLGGDGAILRASRQMGMTQLPILGVNLGRLGFLADMTPDEFCQRFAEIRQRQYQVVEHLMLQCTLRTRQGTSETLLGLNEVAVSAARSMEMIEVALSIDDLPVSTYSCDGLIISTPVGSTAHSLSAGGPAVRQDLPVFVATPICPHTFSNRSLVDDARRTWRLKLPATRTEVVMVVDGQIRRPFQVGDELEIRRADVTFKLARLPGYSYYGVLQKKLGWSGQPRYGVE